MVLINSNFSELVYSKNVLGEVTDYYSRISKRCCLAARFFFTVNI